MGKEIELVYLYENEVFEKIKELKGINIFLNKERDNWLIITDKSGNIIFECFAESTHGDAVIKLDRNE